MPKSDIIAKALHCSLIATVLILAHIEVYWIFCTISSPNKTIQRCGTIRNLIVVYASSIKVYLVGPRGLMDNASDFGSEDSRFESWRGRRSVLACSCFAFFLGSDQRLTLETSLSPFSLLWYNLLYQFL